MARCLTEVDMGSDTTEKKAERSNIKQKLVAPSPALTHMEYISKLLLLAPWPHLARRKAKELIELANKRQVGLGKFKHLICKYCFTVLLPGQTAESVFIKRICGQGLLVKCLYCNNERFTVIRGLKGRSAKER